jgi:hypothetical protein
VLSWLLPCLADEEADEVQAADDDRDHADGHGGGQQVLGDEVGGEQQQRAGERALATSGRPALLLMRTAICGAARATKAMGPALAVTTAIRATPTTSSASRAGSTRMPCALAASSPSSSCRSPPLRATTRIASTASTTKAGTACAQPTSEIDPAPQIDAAIATSTWARSSSQVLNECRIAVTAMPTMMSRKPWMPRR